MMSLLGHKKMSCPQKCEIQIYYKVIKMSPNFFLKITTKKGKICDKEMKRKRSNLKVLEIVRRWER